MPPIIAGVIAGAGSLFGGLAARSGAKSVADQQRQQAQEMFARTKPSFDQAYSYYSGLAGNDPTKLMQAVGPDITNTNMLFQNAQRNMVAGSQGRGGGLTAGLANLEGNRAATLSGLIGTARAGAPAALANLASGQQVQGLQALAGAQQSQFQNSLLQQQAFGGIGSFLMRMLSNPNMFSSNSFSNPSLSGMPLSNPTYGTSTFFNPGAIPNPVVGGGNSSYFPSYNN